MPSALGRRAFLPPSKLFLELPSAAEETHAGRHVAVVILTALSSSCPEKPIPLPG